MARTNTKLPSERTHEGAPASRVGPEFQLRRSVMACLLWEDTFYESGVKIANRITKLVGEVSPEFAANLAIEAREEMYLRHAPLWIVRAMLDHPEHKRLVRQTLARVIQRADELAEFLAMYWKDKRHPLPKQVQRGLADAFAKFNEYSFAKYDRDGAVKLRDVLRLAHPKPADVHRSELYDRINNRTLQTPDTWETSLSANDGTPKKEKWTRLLEEDKLGPLALLRNLRNMEKEAVSRKVIRAALKRCKPAKVLPFRFIAAAKYAPHFEPELETLMLKCLEGAEKFDGHTVLLLDHSGSMTWGTLSGRSDMTRFDAACGLAIIARELCEEVTILCFSERTWEVPPRRGFALRDVVKQGEFGGTYLGAAINKAVAKNPDRLIVLTDEQSRDKVADPKMKRAYMINVANYKNGVAYGNGWSRVDGWSENIIRYIAEVES